MKTENKTYDRTTKGKARFGKKRNHQCECTHMFTCRKCLDDAVNRNSSEKYPKAN